MTQTPLRNVWPCCLSALAVLAAFPPLNLRPLLLCALVPWLLSLQNVSNRGAWKRGYLFGLVFALGQLLWLDTLTARWTDSNFLGLVPWLLASFAMAIYFGLLAMLIRVCWIRKWLWLVPVLWAGMEVFRSYIPVLAFPWGLLASPLWAFPLAMQGAHFGAIYLVSALLVAINLLVALALLKQIKSRDAAILGAFSVGMVIVSVWWMGVDLHDRTTSVSIGQPGVDMAFGTPALQETQVGEAVTDLVREGVAHKSKLLVLPEGIARVDTSTPEGLSFKLDPRLPTIFGAQRGRKTVYQSAFGYDGNWQFVDKTRLVIFGEFVPGRNVIPFLSAFHLPTGDLSAGEQGVQAMNLGGLRVGPLICFEEMFPDLGYRQAMNGAHVLTVMSIDDWFMGSTAPDSLMAASVWRSVETGMPMVRAASLGYSLAADGHGRILATAPLKKKTELQVELPFSDKPTTWPLLPLFPLASLMSLLLTPLAARLLKPTIRMSNFSSDGA